MAMGIFYLIEVVQKLIPFFLLLNSKAKFRQMAKELKFVAVKYFSLKAKALDQ
jgi:hypothetical protein